MIPLQKEGIHGTKEQGNQTHLKVYLFVIHIFEIAETHIGCQDKGNAYNHQIRKPQAVNLYDSVFLFHNLPPGQNERPIRN